MYITGRCQKVLADLETCYEQLDPQQVKTSTDWWVYIIVFIGNTFTRDCYFVLTFHMLIAQICCAFPILTAWVDNSSCSRLCW